jgi:hypothetical protein
MSVVSNSTFSTAAASGGAAGAFTVIVCWLVSLAHVQVPAEVAASFMVISAPLLHLISIWLSPKEEEPDAVLVKEGSASKSLIVTS